MNMETRVYLLPLNNKRDSKTLFPVCKNYVWLSSSLTSRSEVRKAMMGLFRNVKTLDRSFIVSIHLHLTSTSLENILSYLFFYIRTVPNKQSVDKTLSSIPNSTNKLLLFINQKWTLTLTLNEHNCIFKILSSKRKNIVKAVFLNFFTYVWFWRNVMWSMQYAIWIDKLKDKLCPSLDWCRIITELFKLALTDFLATGGKLKKDLQKVPYYSHFQAYVYFRCLQY